MDDLELATAAQYGLDLLVILFDDSSLGTIRIHQEREFPDRVSATSLANPDFAALVPSHGGWARKVESTNRFEDALREAMQRKGIRLLHCVADADQLERGGVRRSAACVEAK